ncbi:MAG: hypothetical protein KDD35_09010 [Bdellovibrionales bacterium]|nr:hypothetical protein [Bdellovibrionales bacterium]
MNELVKNLGIKMTRTDEDYIRISDIRKARGAFRWDYQKQRGEILLAKSANEQTKLHEIGHAINFILGDGSPYSEKIGMESEKFADLVADILGICYSCNQREDAKQNRQ